MLDDLRHSALFIHQNIQEVCFVSLLLLWCFRTVYKQFCKTNHKKLNCFCAFNFILLCSAGYGALSRFSIRDCACGWSGLPIWSDSCRGNHFPCPCLTCKTAKRFRVIPYENRYTMSSIHWGNKIGFRL